MGDNKDGPFVPPYGRLKGVAVGRERDHTPAALGIKEPLWYAAVKPECKISLWLRIVLREEICRELGGVNVEPK